MRLLSPIVAWLALALPLQALDVTDFSLENGLQVVVIPDHRAPVVVHMVWYRTGSADEPPGKSGIAHFLEHLMFKGTDDLAAGELSATVSRNGGTDNAFTSFDFTAYFQRVAADRLGLMMQMEADRMRDLQMTEDDVATERQVILEERSTRTDSDPGALFREQASAAQYLNHPYGIPVIGWRHEMEGLTRADALAFYRRFYAPNNAIVVVAGDVEPAAVRDLAEKYYGPLAPTPDLAPRNRPQEPPQLAERRLIFKDARIGQPYLMRSYLAPERDPGDQVAAARLELLANILGGNSATSVLGRKLQFDSKVAVYATAFYDGLSVDDATFGLVVAPTDGTSLEAAETALDAALDEFMADGIDEAQFERIKMQLRSARIYAEDNVQTLARRYGAELAVGLTLDDIQAWPDILQSVTIEDVMDEAHKVFDRRNAVTGFVSAPDEGG